MRRLTLVPDGLSEVALVFACASLICAAPAGAQQPKFTSLGDLPGGQIASYALGISGDGRVIVGNSHSARGNEAFRWQDGVMTALGGLDENSLFSVAHSVSQDGSVIIGSSTSKDRTMGFRFSNGALAKLEGMPPEVTFSEPWGMSADGSLVVGESQVGQVKYAFTWVRGVVTLLDALPDNHRAINFMDASADGQTMVGNSQTPLRLEAFVARDGHAQLLGGLPGGNGGSVARAVSGDGRVVVGTAPSIWGDEAFMWRDGAMIGLGGLSDHHDLFSVALATSVDGSVIVGTSEGESGSAEAFIWDSRRGMRGLRDVLINEFHLELAGWALTEATAISDDGLTIAGIGRNPDGNAEAWLARIAPAAHSTGSSSEMRFEPAFEIGSLHCPAGVAFTGDGRLLVSEAESGQVRTYTPDGHALPSLIAESSPMLHRPQGIAVAPDGSILIADTAHHRVVHSRADGTLIGTFGGPALTDGALNRPVAVATDGTIAAVADAEFDRIVVFDMVGRLKSTFGSTGDGPGQFRTPSGIAVDSHANFYIADTGNDRVVKLDASGTFVSTWGQRGRAAGMFIGPSSLAVRGDRIMVCDSGNHRVQVFDLSGNLMHIVGRRAMKPHESLGLLHFPDAMAVSVDGSMIALGESMEDRVQVFKCDPAQLSGAASESFPPTPPARSYFGKAMDVQDNIFAVALPDRDAVELYDISTSPAQLITTLGEHGSRFGQFRDITGLRLDLPRHRLFIADGGNRRIQVFELLPEFATGPNPPPPGTPSRARFARAVDCAAWKSQNQTDVVVRPGAMDLSPQGRLAVIDRGNRTVCILDSETLAPLRRITIATAENRESDPVDLCWSADGRHLYVLDQGANTVEVFADNGTAESPWGHAGTGPGELFSPSSICVSADGSVFITDAGNRVQKFDASGTFVRQWGKRGIRSGELFKPAAVAIDGAGRLVVLDWGNHRAHMFNQDGASLGVFGSPMYLRPAQLNLD